MTRAACWFAVLVGGALGCGRLDLDLLVRTSEPDACVERVDADSCAERTGVGCSWQPNDPGCSSRTPGCAPGACRKGDPFVRRVETKLLLNGQSFRFVGVGAWGLLQPGRCRSVEENEQEAWVEQAFDELVPAQATVARLFAFQNVLGAGGRDYTLIDRAVASARRAGIRLLLVLEHDQGDCSQGGARDEDWYRAGYLAPDGSYALAYREHVRALGERYRDEPSVLGYQLMQGLGGQDPSVLTSFISDVGQLLHGVAPSQLIALGLRWPESADTGTDPDAAARFLQLQRLPAVDFVDVYDYSYALGKPPLDPNLLAALESIGKPAIVGEGSFQIAGFAPEQFQARAALASQRMQLWYDAGLNGALLWAYQPDWEVLSEEFDARPEDPLLQPGGVLASSPWRPGH